MNTGVISGTGLFAPSEVISNDELVASFNQFVQNYNHQHGNAIAAGTLPALEESSSAFIFKASGILNRHVINKVGILDPKVMRPLLPPRTNEQLSYQAEMALPAAHMALQEAKKSVQDIDGIIVACSNYERPYPAISIEIQNALGLYRGFAFDLNVACSSATFGLQVAHDMIRSGSARSILVINPEICTAHLDFRDRDSHFIFGDACTATLLEEKGVCQSARPFEVLGAKLLTQFSNNIRNNAGFLDRTHPETRDNPDKLFKQNGRKVFKEVIPLVVHHIQEHLQEVKLESSQLKRIWLHQANLSMNNLIAEKILGRAPTALESPNTLQEYANTSSAGSIIAFHLHRSDLAEGDLGVVCSFGAGYSVGSLIVKRIKL